MNSTDCLQEFGKTIGLDLAFDQTGRCALLIDGEYELCFEQDGEGLILHAILLPSETCTKADYQRLLMVSYLGAQTDRAAFAVNPQSKDITLWRAVPSLEDGYALDSLTRDFLGQVRYWKEELSKSLGQDDQFERNGEESLGQTYAEPSYEEESIPNMMQFIRI